MPRKPKNSSSNGTPLKPKRQKNRSLAAKRAWATRRAKAGFKPDRQALPYVVTDVILDAPEKVPIRAQILDAAKALTMGDRNKLYGDPSYNFEVLRKLRGAFWDGGCPISDWSGAMEMVLIKLARIASAPTAEAKLHRDHYVDAINYLAIALEVARGDPNRISPA